MPRKRRFLSAEEEALWSEVTRSARPLRPARKRAVGVTALPGSEPKRGEPGPGRRGVAANPAKPETPPRPRNHHPQAPLDRRMMRRVARGRIEIDGRLDLHGHNRDAAHERLAGFVADAQARDWRLVLVITGKGGPGDGDRGVLRRHLPHWLGSARFRPFVSGFEQAHRSHGGTGAFYVRIRRPHGRR